MRWGRWLHAPHLICSPMRRACVLLLAAAAVAHSATLRTLTEVDCSKVSKSTIELEVKEARVSIPDVASFNTRLFYYKGKAMYPAPTILMTPGKRCNVKLVNKLSKAGTAACRKDREDMEDHDGMGMFHCADVTNLHTHGLHVSPDQDDVSVELFPGDTRTFTYDVPSDHLPGTLWYHSHHHGSTALQMMGGMAGMLQVVPLPTYLDFLPPRLRPLYASSKHSFSLVLQHVFLGPGDPVKGDMSQDSYEEVSAAYNGQTVDPSPKFSSASSPVKNFYTVNGQYQPTLAVTSGSTVLLRMVHAVGTRAIVLKLSRPDLCQMRLLARDGVFQESPFLAMDRLPFIQATRMDVALMCTRDGNSDVTVNVFATADADEIGPLWGNVHAQASVFSVVIKKELRVRDRVALPVNEPAIPMPDYLQSLLEEPVSGTLSIVDLDDNAINGVFFKGFDVPKSERYLLSPQCLNHVYQIALAPFTGEEETHAGPGAADVPTGDEGLHAYHQHVNHFQIEGFYGAAVDPQFFRQGEFRDTASQLLTNMLIRTKPVDFTGDIVIHCHVSQHGDMGMMALHQVLAEDKCDPE